MHMNSLVLTLVDEYIDRHVVQHFTRIGQNGGFS